MINKNSSNRHGDPIWSVLGFERTQLMAEIGGSFWVSSRGQRRKGQSPLMSLWTLEISERACSMFQASRVFGDVLNEYEERRNLGSLWMWYKYLVGAIRRHISWFCGTAHTGRWICQCREVISIGNWLSEAVHKYLVSATSTFPSPHLSIVSKTLSLSAHVCRFSLFQNTRDWVYVLGLISVAPKPSGDAHMGSIFGNAPWAIARPISKDKYHAFIRLQLTAKPTQAAFVQRDLRYKCTSFLQYKSYHTPSPQKRKPQQNYRRQIPCLAEEVEG